MSANSEALDDSMDLISSRDLGSSLSNTTPQLSSKPTNVPKPSQNRNQSKKDVSMNGKTHGNGNKTLHHGQDENLNGGNNSRKQEKRKEVELRPHVSSGLLQKAEKSKKHNGNGRLVSGRRADSQWEQSKIRYAPLRIPLKQRLQTLMVLWHSVTIVVCLTSFFFLCAIPLLWPILLPYLIYVIFSRAGTSGELSHRSEFMRRSSVWSLYASYFPARLHRSKELVPTRKYVFGYHPHGIIAHGAFASFATEALGFSTLFPGITNTLLTLDSQFRIPIYRDYVLAMGLASVSKESCENILSKGGADGDGMGRAITIVVGGARESLDALPQTYRLVLNRRKGFVKMAIRTGADLVPVLGFGENELYEQVRADEHPRIHKLQLMAKKFLGFTFPLFHARGVFNYDVGVMAYRRPLNVVVGRPIAVQKMEQPDDAYVKQLHGQYVAELQRIWDEGKDVFAPNRTGELEIVD